MQVCLFEQEQTLYVNLTERKIVAMDSEKEPEWEGVIISVTAYMCILVSSEQKANPFKIL